MIPEADRRPPADEWPSRNDARVAQGVAEAILGMHQDGATRGWPLIPEVLEARRDMENAVEAARSGDRRVFEQQVNRAVANYESALLAENFEGPSDLREDVIRRRNAAAALVGRPAFDEQAPAAPAPVQARDLRALRDEIPRQASRQVSPAERNQLVDYRNAGFALDDAIAEFEAGRPDSPDAARAIDRVRFLLGPNRGNRPELAQQVTELWARVRGAQPVAPPPSPDAIPVGQNPFLENPFPDGRAPIGRSGETRGVREAVTVEVAANPGAGQTDEQWVHAIESVLGFTVAPSPNGTYLVKGSETKLREFFSANFPEQNFDDHVGRPVNAHAANPVAQAVDFQAWGDRAAEIATAARNRPSVARLFDPNINESERLRVFREIYGGDQLTEFGGKSYRLFLVGGSVSGNNSSATFSVRDANGRSIGGTVSRTIRRESDGSYSAYNALLELPVSTQKSGFANAFNRHMENWYIANGFKNVRVSAGLDAGGFVWALNGFDWNDSERGFGSQARAKINRLEHQARTPADRAQVAAIKARFDAAVRANDASRIPTPMEIALVGWRPGLPKDRSWLGKDVLLGTSWSGIKDLTNPGSVAYQQRQGYELSRRAGERVSQGVNKVALSEQFRNLLNDPSAALGSVTPAQLAQLRDAVNGDRSLAELPLSTKRALRNWTAARLSQPSADDVSVSDLVALDSALRAEERADYPEVTDLGVGEELRNFTPQDFANGRVPGFTVAPSGAVLGGQTNSTWRVTHDESGQVFFVKNDTILLDQSAARPGDAANAEHDVNVMLRGLGMQGLGRVERATSADGTNMVVIGRVGDSLDLVERPREAGRLASQREILGNLRNWDDPLRMMLVDSVIANGDRHGGNWMAARGRDGRYSIFPIDHGNAASEGALNYLLHNRGPTAMFRIWSANDEAFGALTDYLAGIKRNLGSAGLEAHIVTVVHELRDVLERTRDQYNNPGFVDAVLANLDQLERDTGRLMGLI